MFLGFRFCNPAAPQLLRRNTGKIRLDVQNRGAIEHVHAANMKPRAFTRKKLDHSQANGVRASGRSGGKDAVQAIIDGRLAQQLEAFRPVKGPDHEKMRKAFDVGESRLEFRGNLQNALGIMLDTETLGDFFGFTIWAFDKPDRPHLKHSKQTLTRTISAI